jgi:hypothetical protein
MVRSLGIGRRTVLDERSLNLCRREAMPRDVDNVVYPAPDPVVALVVTPSTVSSKLHMSAIRTSPF